MNGRTPAPPDVIVIGAGTFGAVLTWRLTGRRRAPAVLVLEAGGFERVEHVQTQPVAGLTGLPVGGPWTRPWHDDAPAAGVPHCVGGRSLFWGAACAWPRLPMRGPGAWPPSVAADLRERYLPAAAELLGLGTTPHVCDGPLDHALRDRLAQGLRDRRIAHALPLADHVTRPGEAPGLSLAMAMDIEGEPPNPRRFSAATLLAERLSGGATLDLRTGCRVLGLHCDGERVVAVDTTHGRIAVGPGTAVVLSAGTIENTRLVLGLRGAARIASQAGAGLGTHLRSNLTVSMPPPGAGTRFADWGFAALLVRGAAGNRHGLAAAFHHQITAYPAGALTADAEQALLDSVPRADITALDPAVREPVTQIILTVASVGEMTDPVGSVHLCPEDDRSGYRAAAVRMVTTGPDATTWAAMDRSALDVLDVLAAKRDYTLLRPMNRREPLGFVHHEMGSLAMGSAAGAATDPDGKVRGVRNLFVAGPAVFPSLDSAGPVFPGVALTLRLGDYLLAERFRLARTTA